MPSASLSLGFPQPTGTSLPTVPTAPPAGEQAFSSRGAAGQGTSAPAKAPVKLASIAGRDLSDAVDATNKAYQAAGVELSFEVETPTDTCVVKVRDTTTGEVLRQIPAKEMIALSQSVEQMEEAFDKYMKALAPAAAPSRSQASAGSLLNTRA